MGIPNTTNQRIERIETNVVVCLKFHVGFLIDAGSIMVVKVDERRNDLRSAGLLG